MNELKSLVETQAQEHLRMAKELEKVKSEKVSIEFVLRERVEKLVQVELEARMKVQQQQQQRAGKRHHYGESSSNNNDLTTAATLDATLVVQLQKQLKDLEAENERLKCDSSTSGNALEATQSDEQTKQLYTRCEVLVKERKAVQTIMEHKIKALVNAISEASDATLQSAGRVAQLGEPAKWLTREVNALQRLVNASIIALRNAESGTANTAAANASSPAGVPQSATTATASAKLSTGSSESTTPSSSHVRASSSTRSSGSQFSAGLSHAPSMTATANVSVEELIQQRRAQLQRERQESS